MEDYRRRLDAQIADFESELSLLENGTLHLAEMKPGESHWEESTQREIGRIRGIVENLTAIRHALFKPL